MGTQRKTAAFVGTLFILAAVTSIIGLLLYKPVLHGSEYMITGSAHVSQIATGGLMEVILAFSLIGISTAMFPIVRRYRESIALAYVCFRLLEATIILIGIISLLSAVTLHQHYAEASATDAPSYLTAGRLLVAVHDWTFLFGPNLALGPSTFLMGYFLYRTRVVPRFIAVMGLVAGPLILTSAILVMFGLYDQVSTWGAVLALPVFAYEMTYATWLVVRGFNPSAMASLQRAAGTRDVDDIAVMDVTAM